MTTLSFSLETQAPEQQIETPEQKRKRMFLMLIPVSISLGLLMAISYVGVRIGSAKTRSNALKTQSEAVAPRPVSTAPAIAQRSPAKLATQPAPQTSAASTAKPSAPEKASFQPVAQEPAALHLITPQEGETYLQISAYNPHLVLSYIDYLRRYNIEPRIAPGPAPDVVRVLVGPYASTDALNKARAELEAKGLAPLVRTY